MKYGFINQKCPKCGGKLYLNRDYYIEGSFVSWYEEGSCLQCGFIYSAEIPQKAVITTAKGRLLPNIKQPVTVR